jgi:hypothetical protein
MDVDDWERKYGLAFNVFRKKPKAAQPPVEVFEAGTGRKLKPFGSD